VLQNCFLLFLLLFSFFKVVGFELRAYTLSHSLHQALFCDWFFKIGSLGLFAGVGFEP
jgi:hypothetical protein